MVKITMKEQAEAVTLNIEGRLAGPWAAELKNAWRSLEPSLKSRKLIVNLSGVSFIAPEAEACLREMRSKAGATFVGNSPLTNYFVEKLTKQEPIDGKDDLQGVN